MARALGERNAYKEKLSELEDSIKWAEMERANKMQREQQDVNQKKPGEKWKLLMLNLAERHCEDTENAKGRVCF
uniref:RH2 domain-containing protein n=1 Tax=Caenorhabditis japonica TaxID=281687 RepID=A0A8R1HQR8_CAEJA